jgi:hypothetical protein
MNQNNATMQIIGATMQMAIELMSSQNNIENVSNLLLLFFFVFVLI